MYFPESDLVLGLDSCFFFVFALLEIDNNFFTSKLVSVGEYDRFLKSRMTSWKHWISRLENSLYGQICPLLDSAEKVSR